MKKKYLLIGVPILLIILVLCIFLFSDKTSKYTDNTIDTIRDAIKFIQKNNYNRTGKLKVVASYKGAHGEHYPKDFNYFFETTIVDSNKKVTIGDGKNFVTQDYESDTYDIMYKLKNANVSKLDYLSVKKNGKENLLDVDIINDVFKTNFNKCTIDIKTSGILKNLESSTIKCDNTLTIKLEENKALINYKENVIKVTTNQKGFSINVNDELKLNAFYESDKTRYNIVIGTDVYYLETMENKIYFKSTTQAAIYNAMEIYVDYENVIVNKTTAMDPKEIPVYRYFNEFKYNYWR